MPVVEYQARVYSEPMADIFDVLSDATRRDLLGRLLAAGLAGDGELSVGALVEQTGLSQPTVSKHLRVLRDQGLVTVREEAQHRFYRLDTAPLAEVESWLAPFAADPEGAGSAGGPPPLDQPGQTAFIAWSGAGAGEQIGRAAATTIHQARNVLTALQEATGQARERLADVTDKVADRVKQAL